MSHTFLHAAIDNNLKERNKLNEDLVAQVKTAKSNEEQALRAKQEAQEAQSWATQAEVTTRNEVATSLENSSNTLSAASEQLATQIEQVSSGAEKQHLLTAETATLNAANGQ